MKQIISLLTILLMVNVLYSQSINDSLLLHYPLNGDAIDLSGNGYDGEVNATPTFDRFGNSNSAFLFNGINEFIDLPNSSDLKPEFPVSFSFWMKLNDLQPQNTTLFTTNHAESGHSGVWMNLSTTGYLAINYGDATGAYSAHRRTKVGTTLLATDVWYHVVGIVNDATDMEIYINCINDGGTYNGSGGNIVYTSAQGSVGRKANNYFMGSLDDFRYWNRELTLNDIYLLCNNQVSVVELNAIDPFNIFVYPNPTNDIFHIEVDKPSEIPNIVMYNTIGEIVHYGKLQQELLVDHLGTGIYFLHFLDQDSKTVDVIKIAIE